MTALSHFKLISLAGILALACAAHAKITPRDIGKNLQRATPIVFDHSNTPHVFYQGPDYRIYHAWAVGAKWQRELIEAGVDAGFGISAAIDPAGTIHVSYGAYRGIGLPKLVYARRNPSSGWIVTDIGVDGTDTAIQIDAENQPHIYFGQLFETAYAYRDDDTWIVESTGLPNTSYRGGFVLDDTGAAHIAYAVGLQGLYYATNDSGDWVATLLTPDWGNTAIDLDSAMAPHVVLAAGDQIVHYSKPGDDWESEIIVDTTMLPDVNMEQIALAIGPDDSLHMLGGASIAGVLEVPFYIYPNGEGWAIYLLEAKNSGFYPVITPDNNAVMHATYSTATRGNTSTLRYVALPLADLSGTWTAVAITEKHGKLTLNATIEVQNTGVDASAKTKIALYLSDDETLSEDDTPLSTAPSLKAIKPGSSTIVRLKARLPSDFVDGFLIAHLDPVDMVADSDATNNIIATLLPPSQLRESFMKAP